MSQSPRVVVGVGGGVAAFKAAALVSQLAQRGYQVQVVMSAAATKFVGPATFTALSGRAVATDLFQQDKWPLGPHIELAVDAKLFLHRPSNRRSAV